MKELYNNFEPYASDKEFKEFNKLHGDLLRGSAHLVALSKSIDALISNMYRDGIRDNIEGSVYTLQHLIYGLKYVAESVLNDSAELKEFNNKNHNDKDGSYHKFGNQKLAQIPSPTDVNF